ncbi:MAG: RDD family protein [Myxococcota bacterium]
MLDGRIAEDTRPSVSMPPVDEKALERSRRLSSVVPAGFGRRAAAYTLDVLIGTVAGVLIGLGGGKLVAEGFAQAALYGYLSFALGVVGLVLGRALADAAGGGTVGKRLMDLVVTSEELRPLPFLRAVARAVLLVVDGFMFGLVGYLVMSESPTQQTTGDQVARAVVVRRAGLDEDAARLNWLGPALGVLVPVLMSVAAIAIGKVLGWLQ